MSKKKLISIVLSVLLSVLAAVCGCVFGVDVDFGGVGVKDVGNNGTDTVNVVALTHGEEI